MVGAYLKDVSFNHWARSFSDGKRFDIIMKNIAECLNAALTNAQKLSIQYLMEYIRNMHQHWFYERQGDANGNSGGIIELNARSCTCRVFEFDQLPCGHALVAARSCIIDPYTLCSSYYQTKALLGAYIDSIMPAGSQADWTVMDEITSCLIAIVGYWMQMWKDDIKADDVLAATTLKFK
ncbi:uncharacterized protein LOC127801564 [Diospyros lotus]|uniref:uncharacterized protein LOC127801564 n=1 Tax=Diospyros lotus TaxID=55363 RepID=UPI002253880F|nr:uncharacterized protein LOC127801564 [Diospyros lotus]